MGLMNTGKFRQLVLMPMITMKNTGFCILKFYRPVRHIRIAAITLTSRGFF